MLFRLKNIPQKPHKEFNAACRAFTELHAKPDGDAFLNFASIADITQQQGEKALV
jgi:hypothetical protein